MNHICLTNIFGSYNQIKIFWISCQLLRIGNFAWTSVFPLLLENCTIWQRWSFLHESSVPRWSLVPGPSGWGTPFLLLHSRPWLDFSWTLRANVTCHLSVHLCGCFSCSRKYFSEYNLSKGLSGFWRHVCLQSLIRSREHKVMELHHASDSHTLLIQRGRWKINPFITLLSLRPFLTHGTHLERGASFVLRQGRPLASAEKTENVKGEAFFLPFIPYHFGQLFLWDSSGWISVSVKFYLFLVLRNEKLAFCDWLTSCKQWRVFNFLDSIYGYVETIIWRRSSNSF